MECGINQLIAWVRPKREVGTAGRVSAVFICWCDMARVCIFVDGENFRHSIVDLFRHEFDQSDYLPRQAEWAELFDWISRKCAEAPQRVRTYWYVIRSVDFFPFGLERLSNKPEQLRGILSKHPEYKSQLDTIADSAPSKPTGKLCRRCGGRPCGRGWRIR